MENTHNNDSVMFPDAETDYHGHPNYGKVLIILLLLFGASLVMGYFFSPLLAVIMIFAIAVIKIIYVMGNFMHLRYEPLLIFIAVAFAVFCLLAFFWGVYPDIVPVKLDVAPR